MAHASTSEGATNSVKSVTFSFITNEELIKTSSIKITNPILCNTLGEPVPGGLYDPALGPLLDNTSICVTCGLSKANCSGHFGHIELVNPIYNPMMFPFLGDIINLTCFSCHHFKASRNEVEKRATQLELILKGNISKSRSLNEIKLDDHETVDSADDDEGQCSSAEKPGGNWSSLQFSEAMSVIKEFMKTKYKKCLNCGNYSPKITKPNFGWFHVKALKASQVRSNIITGNDASLASETINDDISLGNGDCTEEEDIASGGTATSNAEKHNRKKLILFQQTSLAGSLLPSQVKQILEFLWENEARLCSHISDIQDQGFGKKAGHSMFFLENIFVPPIRFRPPLRAGDKVADHPQTVLLNKVLESNISLGDAHRNKSAASIVLDRWRGLQESVNLLFNNKTAKSQKDVAAGICQLLEKKEGIFRQKMMGKRVNFACRSVISPDPYLAVNEIGIPPYFALRLTYPERVTPWNVVKLRDAVLNGSETHPGATLYADKSSTIVLNKEKGGKRDSRIHTARRLQSTRGVIMHHGKIHDQEFEGKIVYRHLKDGDVVLVNRQPTLHKPSIMAHVVRVLKGEKTVRMHYANCSTYNADFDGDEINVHFPQDEISRAEAYNIVNANNQYMKPTSGEPLRALIQDHIVSAALLTKKDTFLSCEQFNQLLYSSGVSMTGTGTFTCKPGQKISMSNSESEMFLFPPAIFKPEPLWTGKQVISALLRYITKGRPPFTVEKNAKLPSSFFKTQMREEKKHTTDTSREKEEHEDKLLIYRNDLVRGVIDKAQFGDYGMVHTVQEFYGSNTAGIFLSALSRLFTNFLQMHGFTCGVDDLLITEGKDSERIAELESCEIIGDKVHREFIGVMKDANIDPITMQLNVEKKIRSDGEAAAAHLDMQMISHLNDVTGKKAVLKNLLSEGILKPSGKNCISLMTTSGAKGGMINFQQISSYLGQQTLEGKRVPNMVSGKSLPCFPSWDCSPRAGGFITDRFLTALRPQEYYFHCMAGREGLVDTAVKTSRSGYLQRCLIKNLESLKVCYDHTVRDADGSIIQFHYGEDGVDVHQTSFVTKFEALSINEELVYSNCCRQLDRSSPYINKLPDALKGGAENFIRDFSSKQRNSSSMKHADFLQLMEHKYVSSLAQPGEPVGVLASQSVGEPATQMTLNTFHLAGRGEMNVTLGIPRLQEIVVAASNKIKTPFMTCPLRVGKSKEDAERLADKMKKITVADIIERIKVTVVSITERDGQICHIYKLTMKLYKPIHYPKYTDVTLEDWEDTLRVGFVRGLEDAIQNHIVLLGKISGIKDYKDKPNSSNGVKNDHSNESESNRNDQANDDDDGDVDDNEDAEDLGFDAQKSKQQAMDEVEYEDGSEEETHDGEDDADRKGGKDGNFEGVEHGKDEEDGKGDGDEDDSDIEVNGDDSDIDVSDNDKNVAIDANNSQGREETSKSEKRKSEAEFKENDRRIYVKARGMRFEIHFKFPDAEPHILLAQIAQRTAKNVCIQNFGKVGQCKVITCKEAAVMYYGEDVGKRDDIPSLEKAKINALQTSGIHFKTFWEMQDDLNVRYIYSNSVHDVLNTYGVEAAKEIIIREVKSVFKVYGITVNIRHLMLIADFMTHTGGYRPLTRKGIQDSTSPFVKMSFETASNFIVEAAYHGQVDTLETPSSRICLGLPVKMGTGCHDLIQKLEI
ncbi:unnamed protein product [Trifolium pratense]|uniref:Uncharacterized protein n=1 Tax=Trifolium pratense TaxID=57577 RepID=A0ACB0KA10_TRIPR|nr:unnamed protein product [Trifolium pratense]